MIVLDTSALLAVILAEPDAETYARTIRAAAPDSVISVISVLEASIVLSNRHGDAAADQLDEILDHLRVRQHGFFGYQLRIAREAYRQFGEGRHPASLNFGDCCSYATAVALSGSLLFKGDDFSRTDVSVAALLPI